MGKLEELRAQKIFLTQRIRILKDNDAAERKERVAHKNQERLASTLKTHGGKKLFIERFGKGKLVDESLNVPKSRCAFTYITIPYALECRLLGVKPNWFKHRCMFNGNYDFRGEKFCKKHLEMLSVDGKRRGSK